MKIFAHRGLVTRNSKENSIESLDEAFKNKFYGIEFDIWFVSDQLYIKHDQPKKEELTNLPKFRDYLKYGNNLRYWLDFKNLDKHNIDKALEIIKKDLEDKKIDLNQIYFAPFITDLVEAAKIYKKIKEVFSDAQIMAVCEDIKKEDLENYHQNLQKNNIKFLSIRHVFIDKNFMKIFHDINLYAWTINDLARAKELESLGVKIITSDIIL